MNIYRYYTDQNTGKLRRIKFIRTQRYLVEWAINVGPCLADVWELEDGSEVQIPREAWKTLGLRYRDVYDKIVDKDKEKT